MPFVSPGHLVVQKAVVIDDVLLSLDYTIVMSAVLKCPSCRIGETCNVDQSVVQFGNSL
jgi:hypothetical protein